MEHTWQCSECDGAHTWQCCVCDGAHTWQCSECDGAHTWQCCVCDGAHTWQCSECDGAHTWQCCVCDGAHTWQCSECDGAHTWQCCVCDGAHTWQCCVCDGAHTWQCCVCDGAHTWQCSEWDGAHTWQCCVCDGAHTWQCSECDGAHTWQVSVCDTAHGGLSQRRQYKRYCGRRERRRQPFCPASVSVSRRCGSASASAVRGEEARVRPGGMSWALGRWRARRLRLPGTRTCPARRRGPEGADPEHGAPILFSTSKASPRVWSVSQSMGSDHERPWAKVLPLSLLCTGLLLWCVFREPTEIDERLEAVFSGQMMDSSDAAQGSNAPLQLPKEK
ncbi:uncharacterized protein LOC136017062 [Lathamus discolor]|uniref:uncharacterized protein LOC136017062 n=1 Tax=Lathamus discolor TaxID=678569 RepID=UPI0032B7277E